MTGYILAFDFGLKRIGVAIGNPLTDSASPLTTLRQARNRPDWEEIDRIISAWKPVTLILGMPECKNASSKELCQRIKKFGQELQTRYDLPLNYVDERLSSVEAEAKLKSSRQSGTKSRLQKTDIDQEAAAIMLVQWLNEQKNAGPL